MISNRSTECRSFDKELAKIISFKEIASAAVESEFIIRSRKVFPIEFLLTLIFGFYSKEEPSISKLHRIYNSLVHEENGVVYSSFYDRFSNEALTFVDMCLEKFILKQMHEANSELKGYLRTFHDVLIKDNTIVRVHSYLADKYPATRARRIAAGIKVSLLLSVVCNGPKTVEFFPEKTNDSKTLTIGPWVKGILLLMDRGFFKFDSFAKIDSFGGCFVTRLKSNTKALVVSVSLDVPEKIRKKMIGQDIRKAIELVRSYKLTIDARVAVSYFNDSKKKTESTLMMRFIAIFDEKNDDYHTYFTNIPENDLLGKDVASLYAARWDIENLFKELKSEDLLGRMKSKNDAITEIFIRIPIIRLIISRKLFSVARRILNSDKVNRLKKGLWSIVFAENARWILRNLMRRQMGLRLTFPMHEIWETIVVGAISAHVNRKTHTYKFYL